MYKIRGSDGREYGPATVEQLRQWLAENRVNAHTLVQAEGGGAWQPLSSLPEFVGPADPLPAAPAPLPGAYPAADPRALAMEQVKGPATALMVTGIISVLWVLFSLVSRLVQGEQAIRSTGNPEFDRIMQMSAGPLGLVLNFIQLVVSGLIIHASQLMKRLESYNLVFTAVILFMLPCLSPCCPLGLGFGIWALVILNKPEVRGAFH